MKLIVVHLAIHPPRGHTRAPLMVATTESALATPLLYLHRLHNDTSALHSIRNDRPHSSSDVRPRAPLAEAPQHAYPSVRPICT